MRIYDLGGSLTEKKHFGYTESEDISTELIKTDTYTYASTWKDLLTGYHGGTIQYDGIGNPTAYLGKSLDPTGRFAISAIIIGTLLGAAIGFGGTVLADYADDGKFLMAVLVRVDI